MPTAADTSIQDVWNYNLDDEFRKIRDTIEKYPFVAMVRSSSCALY